MDDMKRVTIREQNYFYHNISNTPFTLGIAFPSKYGQFRVTGGTEITRNKADAAKVFSSDRWKLHPDWVYCEYNYAGSNDRQFDSPENNMRHFLDRVSHEGAKFNWGSSRVRPLPTCAGNGGGFTADCPKSLDKREVEEKNSIDGEDDTDSSGGDEEEGSLNLELTLPTCDKELVQALVLDGEITQIFDSQESRQDLFKEFGIELSFVATRSGLTRWEEHKETDEFADEEEHVYDEDNPKEPHFSEVNNEATDEVWYERAVEYHFNNPNSFVFSVPFDIGDTRPTLVTATHAVFREHEGQKAPAAVVGVHIDYDKFETNFMTVTTGPSGSGFKTNSGEFLSCKNESIECYVLDNNGFVMISEDPLNTGKFFGEIDGTILKSLEQNHVFKKIKIYDYQAICLESADDGSPAEIILTPFKLMAWLFNWLIGNIAMTIIRLEIHHLWNPDWTWAMPQPQVDYVDDDYSNYGDPSYYNDGQYDDDYQGKVPASEEDTQVVSDDQNEAKVEQEPYDEFADEVLNDFKMKDGGPIPLLEMTYINKTQPKPCDKEAYLYELDETALQLQRPLQGILRNCHESDCERPFSVTLIPNTNLVLVVADKMCPCFSARISVAPTKVEYNDGSRNETGGNNYCEKLKTNLYRKKPMPCVHYHPQEEEISLCGGSSSLLPSLLLLLLPLLRHL